MLVCTGSTVQHVENARRLAFSNKIGLAKPIQKNVHESTSLGVPVKSPKDWAAGRELARKS